MLLIHALAARYRAWLAYRRFKSELTQLDDRGLHDMGYSRGEIDFVARQAAASIR